MTDSSSADPAFADLLDELLAALLDGDEPDLAALAARHPAVAHRLDEAHRLACSVAGRRTSTRPSLRGYQIVRELGRGGMGTVYLARQQDLDREVALKVLPHSFGLSAHSRQRFLDEARALARVQHEHIVGIHRIVDDGDLLAFEMEYVDGPSLQDVLAHLRAVREQGAAPSLQHVADLLRLPLASLGAPNLTLFFVRLGRAIGRALGAVHAAGFVHRDVKPSNILLRQNGQPVLADFGLVRDTALERSHKTGFVGTPVYSSPEQLRGNAPIGPTTDVYALGVTLYECLTLSPPFAGRTTTDLLSRIENGRIPPLRASHPEAPRDLETILVHAMELEPEQRYRDGAEFADDLQRLLDLLPIRAQPVSLLRRVDKFARRNRRPLLAGLVGAALVALLMVPLLNRVQAADRRQQVARDELRAAREVLLSSEVRLHAWQRGVWGATQEDGARARDAALQRSAAHYERALAADPTARAVRRELAVVRMALWQRQVLLFHAQSISLALASDEYRQLAAELPQLTRRLAASSAAGTTADLDLVAELRAAGDDEQAAFGLLAFLVGELRWCEAAWEDHAAGADDEPLRDAVLGLLYLTDGAPERAYVRLRAAQRTLPDPVLALELADAALAMGETRQAAAWFELAKDADDPPAVRARVAADLQLAAGDIDGARQCYRDLARDNRSDPTPHHRLAQLAIRAGDLARAAATLDEMLQQWPTMTRLRLDRARVALLQRDVLGYVQQVVALLGDEQPMRSQGSATDLLELLRIGGLEDLYRRTHERLPEVRLGRSLFGGEVPLAGLRPRAAVDQLQAMLPTLAWLAQRRDEALGQPSHLDPWTATLLVALPFAANRLPGLAPGASPLQRLVLEAVPWLARRSYRHVQPYVRWLAIQAMPGPWHFFQMQPVRPPADLAPRLSFGGTIVPGADWNDDGVAELLVAANTPRPENGIGRAFVVDGRSLAILANVSGSSPEHLFGYALALVGDIDGDGAADWLVGAPAGTPAARDGCVEVISGRLHRPLATLRGSGVAFGVALSGTGDVDGDGVPDFAVGMPPIARNATGQGSVTIFSGRTRLPLRTLTNRVPGIWFGAALADAGDTDGDGVHDLVVGGNFGGAPGTVFLYSGRTGEVLHTWSDDLADSGFGITVAGAGDLDGDGAGDVVVSAVRRDPRTGLDQVRVYSGRTGALRFTLRGDRPGIHFGAAIARYPTPPGRPPWIAIGAPLGGEGSSGAVLVIDEHGRRRATLQGAGMLSRFGSWVVPVGDVDGDGRPELFVSSPGMPASVAVTRVGSRDMQFSR